MIAQLSKQYIMTRPWKILPRLISYALFEGRPLTTRGQWINPLVFGLFRLEKHLPPLKKVNKPIFIVGTGRSGTTMMGVLLSLHPDIGFLNEPKALWHCIYPYEDVIGSYSRGNARFRLTKDDVTGKVKKTAHRLFGVYLAITGAGRVVDKYPEIIFRIPFVREIFFDAKFVFLVRNGWDTCSSIKIWSKRKGVKAKGEIHDWWGADNRKWKIMVSELVENDPYFSKCISSVKRLTSHSDRAVVEWIVTMREGLNQMQQNSQCIYMIRYEDLVQHPESELIKLLEFCKLGRDAKLDQYTKKQIYRRKPHQHFKIHPEIEPLFQETMTELGYD